MKHSYGSTEFILTVIGNCVFIAGALSGIIPKEMSEQAVKLFTSLYIVIRGLAKIMREFKG